MNEPPQEAKADSPALQGGVSDPPSSSALGTAHSSVLAITDEMTQPYYIHNHAHPGS